MIGTDAHLFGRVVTAMVTPFDSDLKIDYAALEKVIEHLLSTGTDALVVAGTTGESPTLEASEKKELLKAVIKQTAGRAKVVMGTGSNNTAHSVQASREAEEAGADGLLVVAPYYNKPCQDGLLAHFEAVLNATSLPVMLYNIPGRTGVNVSPRVTIDLSRHYKNLHALKDSTGSVDQAGEIAAHAAREFRIYSGDDNLTLPFLSVGACGVVSVASHIIGKQLKEMVEAHFAGNSERARELHYQYLPIMKGLFLAPNPTCVKYALAQMGLCKPYLRLPLVPLSGPNKQAVDELLKDLKTSAVTA